MRNPFIVLLILPALEIGLLALFGSRYGLGAVALEVFGTSLMGLYLIRRAGYRNLVRANERLRESGDAPEQVLDDLLRAIAGLLLVIPGIATDLVALFLLLPGTRRRLARSWIARGEVFHYQAGWEARQPDRDAPDADPAPRPERRNGGNVIEGEFTRED